MKFDFSLHSGGGFEETQNVIMAKIASSLYLALFLYRLAWIGVAKKEGAGSMGKTARTQKRKGQN